MQRRKTTTGGGACGYGVPSDRHAAEVLDRILGRMVPVTEDAVFLAMCRSLRRMNDSVVSRKVRFSEGVGRYRCLAFSSGIDLVEARRYGAVEAHRQKGYRKTGRAMKALPGYEGIDQTLAMLRNPVVLLGRGF